MSPGAQPGPEGLFQDLSLLKVLIKGPRNVILSEVLIVLLGVRPETTVPGPHRISPDPGYA